MPVKPTFLVLCAIWNHQQHWTENLIQLFLDQDYAGNHILVLIDDRPVKTNYTNMIYKDGAPHKVVVTLQMPERAPFLMAKYDFGIEHSVGLVDYVCVWDDDDIYLPYFLSDHAEVLADHQFSYPLQVHSSYGGHFRTEDTGGRFWASSAYRASALQAIGGYGTQTLPWFDQEFLSRMEKEHGAPGRVSRPGYIYNWEASQDSHVSHFMGDTDWYERCPHADPVGALEPKYNAITRELLALAAREIR